MGPAITRHAGVITSAQYPVGTKARVLIIEGQGWYEDKEDECFDVVCGEAEFPCQTGIYRKVWFLQSDGFGAFIRDNTCAVLEVFHVPGEEESEAPQQEDSKVEHPAHYNTSNIEVWDFIADQGLDFFLGNVIKYVCRAPYKEDSIKDLEKARAYIDKKINELEG